MASGFLVIALVALSQILPSAGHGYRNKALRKIIPLEERFYNHVPPPQLEEKDVPREFNWCDVNGTSYCTASWNQHVKEYCGACWVHATLSALNDRLKIQKGGRTPDIMLGRQTLLNCAGYHGNGEGCNGGDTFDVYKYMTKYGLPDEGCMPYSATDHTKFSKNLKRCPAEAHCQNCMPVDDVGKCWAIKRPVMYYLKSWGQVGPHIQDMYSEILARGPITCGMDSTDEFAYNYRGGVYRTKNKKFDLDHDVEIVGWGVDEKDVPYWLIRNSWGQFWGEMGFFKLERGVNALGIESGDCWYGVPEFGVEERVVKGDLVGTMYGLVKKKKASETSDDDYSGLIVGGDERSESGMHVISSASDK